MNVSLLLLASYVMGSVPSSHLAGRWAGVDLSRRGSGNLGATNVFRVLGWKAALPVVGVDVAKGFVPVWFFPALDGNAAPVATLAYGGAAIAGHIWSVFTRFRGGKGVATSGGVLLALVPFAVLVGALIWTGLALLTRTVSIASLAAATAVPVIAWMTDAPDEHSAFTAGLALLVWWTHRENIARLVRGRELSLGGDGAGGEGSAAGPRDEPGVGAESSGENGR